VVIYFYIVRFTIPPIIICKKKSQEEPIH